MKYYSLVYSLAMSTLTMSSLIWSGSLTAVQKLLIIDTQAQGSYQFRNITALAESVGFSVDYLPFYDIRNTDQLDPYQALFLVIDNGFLTNQNVITQLVTQAITEKQHKKLIGLLLPNRLNEREQQSLFTMLSHFQISNSLQLNTVKNFINMPKSIMYSPSLGGFFRTEQEGLIFDPHRIKQLYALALARSIAQTTPSAIPHDKQTLLGSFAPRKPTFSHPTEGLWPLGLYLKNKNMDSIFFISKTSWLTFADIEENFRINPIDPQIRQELFKNMQQLCAELYEMVTIHNIPLKNTATVPQELPAVVTPEYEQDQRALALSEQPTTALKRPIIAGWLNHPNNAERIKQLAAYIYKAKLNLLWIHQDGICNLFCKEENKAAQEKMMQETKRFLQELTQKYAAAKTKKSLPRFFMGLNYFGTQLDPRAEKTHDIFGVSYDNMPTPFDQEYFWEPLVLKPFERYCDQWQETIQDLMPLSGIFFDFEMYSSTIGTYNDLTDFSQSSWNLYQKYTIQQSHREELQAAKNVTDRVSYLYKHQLFNDYFAVLSAQARLLGTYVKDRIYQKLPNAHIGVYLPALTSSWFYTHFFAGLSSPDRPIILATFNNNAYSHYAWLKAHGIHAYHLPAILFSKLTKEEDFKIVDTYLNTNDGFWLNRVNWLTEPKKEGWQKEWWTTEASPLPSEYVVQQIANHIKASIGKKKKEATNEN